MELANRSVQCGDGSLWKCSSDGGKVIVIEECQNGVWSVLAWRNSSNILSNGSWTLQYIAYVDPEDRRNRH